jgi:serine/threonine-protein kinase
MKRCGKCNSLTDDTLQVCPHDGATLEVDFIAGELQETLGEKYTLTQLIGQGSMGAVFRANHRDLDEVAIKIMLGQKNNAQLSERFLREARALRRLRHPNAVLVYDLERSPNGVSFMVMEMVKGVSLRRELDKRRTLPLEDVVAIAEAVCAALQEAHEQGIIHRDIKPDNILVAEELLASGRAQKRIKLVDFGVVKLPSVSEGGDPERPITRAGTPIGTPFYMSPEQWFGEGSGIAALDGRTDIYGLGCTLYEMLAGRVPFVADNTKEMRRLHLQTDPQPLAEAATGVPWPVSDVIMRALEKDRADRQVSVEQFAAELRAAYDESFRETAQLSAERLAAARAAWGESDAPVNEQQMAPTYNKSAYEDLPDDDFRLAPTDSGEATPTGTEDNAGAGTSVLNDAPDASSANAWAPTATPDPPAPGDTGLLHLPRRTERLQHQETMKGRVRDLTVPPQAPPVLPEQVTEEAKAAPPRLEPPRLEPPKPKTPEEREREATTHQLMLPDSVLVKSPPQLPEAPPDLEKKAEKPAPVATDEPPAHWRKVALGGLLAALLAAGGGVLYWKWPRPHAPNTNQTDAPGRAGEVRLPSFGLITVYAPKGSAVFVDDERVANIGDNSTVGAQAAPGVRNVRVQPSAANLYPYLQNVRVTANGTAEVRLGSFPRPEPGPAADAATRLKRAAAQTNPQFAEAEYRKLLEESPGNTEARRGLAQVLETQKRYGDALVELETMSRMMPKNIGLLRDLARIYAIKQQDASAERALLQALRQAPRNASLRLDFARLLTRQPSRLEDALRETDTALKNRETAEALDAKARVLIEKGAAEDALKFAEKAATREPNQPAWQATLAVTQARAGKTEEAQKTIRALLQRDKDTWSDLKALSQTRFYGKVFLDALDTLIARQ